MTIQVVFVSSNASILDLVTHKKTALVPWDIRAENYKTLDGEEVAVSAYEVLPRTGIDELLAHLEDVVRGGPTAIVLMSDGSIPNLPQSVGDFFSVNVFSPPAHGAKIQNIIQAVLAKALKNFRYYRMRFADLKYQQILRLPLRNFAADEIAQLRTLCWDMLGSNNFGRQLDHLLGQIKSRQRPKKTSSHPDKYFVDDEDKHFRLGPEVHAQADTSRPPHSRACILGNKFRFGSLFEGEKHFNVSREGNALMSSRYIDCHDASREGGGVSHLNMFSNDFF
ncbi:hypothetical protein [Rhizobium leguminosarum]|uniref:hypothetical protein n=1 Tax=Rhizobium leguminosarum TaxID=384 RepID=UPI003F9A4CF1